MDLYLFIGYSLRTLLTSVLRYACYKNEIMNEFSKQTQE